MIGTLISPKLHPSEGVVEDLMLNCGGCTIGAEVPVWLNAEEFIRR